MSAADQLPTPLAKLKWERFAVAVAFIVLAVVLFAAAMTGRLNYDEEQYIAGAYFARDLKLYRDFVSFQPPMYTWILAAAFELSGGWYLLVARLITWTFSLGCCTLLFSLLLTLGTGPLVASALVLMFVACPFAWIPLTAARNDIMPLFWLLLGIWLCFYPTGRLTASAARSLFAGLVLSLAASTKYTYGFAAPIMGVAVLYDEYVAGGGKWRFAPRRTAAFVLGAALGALPLVYFLVVDRERFLFLTLFFHLTAIPQWYDAQGAGYVLTFGNRIRMLLLSALQGSNAALLLVVTFSAFALAVQRYRNGKGFSGLGPAFTLLALLLSSLVLAFATGPAAGNLSMYYVGVAALAVLLAGWLYAAVRSSLPAWAPLVIVILGVGFSLSALSEYRVALERSLYPSQWAGVQTHDAALKIADILARHGVSGHVATLFPMVALDANRVLPQFAAGPFFYRSADLYNPDEVARLRGVGPATMDHLFMTASPPAAVVGGFGVVGFQHMDRALIEYARRMGYVLVLDGWTMTGYRQGQLWVRRASGDAAAAASR
ncbi:MAG TPA: hypothetical protein VFB54_19005 [Burkholderiales bacterium]|nr:hypothetical protein [Burkholderiales bacterium]